MLVMHFHSGTVMVVIVQGRKVLSRHSLNMIEVHCLQRERDRERKRERKKDYNDWNWNTKRVKFLIQSSCSWGQCIKYCRLSFVKINPFKKFCCHENIYCTNYKFLIASFEMTKLVWMQFIIISIEANPHAD